jgi:hypothetical protein
VFDLLGDDLALVERRAGDGALVHLVGAVDDAERADVLVELRQREVLPDAVAAADLHAVVDHLLDRLGGEHLRHRDLVARLLAGRYPSGGVSDHRPDGVESRLRVGDVEPQRLLLDQRVAEGVAIVHVRLRDLERPVGHPDEPHAVRQAGGAEPLLRDGEPGVLRREEVLLRDAHAVVEYLRVGQSGLTHVRHVADHFEAVGVGVDDEQRRARVGVGLLVGPGDDDEEVRVAALRRPPLVPVDDPLVAVLLGGGPDLLGVRTGRVHRLGHREPRGHLGVRQRPEVRLLLGLGARRIEDVDVPFVGGGDLHRPHREDAPPGLLEDRQQVVEVEAEPAVLRRYLRAVDVPLAGRLAEVVDEVARLRLSVGVAALVAAGRSGDAVPEDLAGVELIERCYRDELTAAAETELAERVESCGTAAWLRDLGFEHEVEDLLAFNSSETVPRLRDGGFVA